MVAALVAELENRLSLINVQAQAASGNAGRAEGLLINGGGHPMAAGLTVARDALPALQDFLCRRAAERLRQIRYRPTLQLDAVVGCSGATAQLVRQTERMAPYGVGNPEPRFAFRDWRLAQLDTVGETHLRCHLEGPGGTRLNAIAFRALDRELGNGLLGARGRGLLLAGRLELDAWRGGDNVQLVIEDAAEASSG